MKATSEMPEHVRGLDALFFEGRLDAFLNRVFFPHII